jgi:hypothetical protein
MSDRGGVEKVHGRNASFVEFCDAARACRLLGRGESAQRA